MVLNFWVVLLLTVCLWAQQSSVNKTEKVAIQRAKNLVVSSFDRSLPNVSLEFFLKYEGGGAPIKWDVNDCDQTGSPALDQEHGSPMCVEADFEFEGQTAVTILVSVGTFKRGPSAVPALISVTITENGTSRSVRHLSDLPVELHRPAPKLPRDLPVPMGALSSTPNHRTGSTPHARMESSSRLRRKSATCCTNAMISGCGFASVDESCGWNNVAT